MASVLEMPAAVDAGPAGPRPKYRTVADLLDGLGGIPAGRVVLDPVPGTATEADAERHHETVAPCELIDGVIVEKPMGWTESFLPIRLAVLIETFLAGNDLGFLAGSDMFVRLTPTQTRAPDLCFVPWSRRPERTIPRRPVPGLVPALVVEVLSPTNTRPEMARKRAEYFAAGVELVWEIDPATRTAAAYTGPDAVVAVPAGGALYGGLVLPGFTLPLATLFARLEPLPPAAGGV